MPAHFIVERNIGRGSGRRYMSTSAAARILEVSDETVRRWLEDPLDPDEILGETATMTKKKAAEIWMQKLVEAAAAKTQPDDDQKENENSGDQKAETDFGNITFEQHATSGRSIS